MSVLILAIITFSALAVISNIQNNTNKFSVGSQTIEISEDKFKITSDDVIVSGNAIEKNPTVTNIGTTDCYIRAYVGCSDVEFGNKHLNINICDGWYIGDDGYYYHPNPIAPNESITFFDKIFVYDTDEFECDVFVYAESIDANDNDYATAWGLFDIVPAQTVARTATVIIKVIDLDNTVVDTLTYTVEEGTKMSSSYLWGLVESEGYSVTGVFGSDKDTVAQAGQTYSFKAEI